MSTSRLENNTQALLELLDVINHLPSTDGSGTIPPETYEFLNVVVTADGEDVTSRVFVNGKINLSEVTGHIELSLDIARTLNTPEISIWDDTLTTPEIEIVDDEVQDDPELGDDLEKTN